MILLTSNHVLPLLLIALFGLIMGSILIRVIHTYPLYLKHEWQRDYAHLSGSKPATAFDFRLFLKQPSFAYHSLQQQWYYHCFPLVFLRVRDTSHPLHKQYMFAELLTMCTIVAIYLCHGWSSHAFYDVLCACLFIILSFIDCNERILPDFLTLGLLWLGLLSQINHPLQKPVLGVILGYLMPYIVNLVYVCIRKKTGMGQGDFKLLAAIGAWSGPIGVLFSYFMAASLSVIIALPFLLTRRLKLTETLPFGPFLCCSGWLCIEWHNEIESFFRHLILIQ